MEERESGLARREREGRPESYFRFVKVTGTERSHESDQVTGYWRN